MQIIFSQRLVTGYLTRARRAARLEAEYITSILNPPTRKLDLSTDELFQGEIIDPGLPAAMNFESARPLVSVFQRYGTTTAHGLFRNLHELERRQRMRQGEHVPAPVTVDLSVHDDTAMESVTPPWRQSKAVDDQQDGN